MGESNFFSQEIKRAINREQKAIGTVRDKKQKQERDRIKESEMTEKKWSTKAPHFTATIKDGYAAKNAIQKSKRGGLHPTWRSSR